MPLRLVFMGTPDFAVPTLTAIVAHGHNVVAVYTRAPRPAGRGMELRPSPVEREARRFGIPVLTPKTLRSPETQDALRAHQPVLKPKTLHSMEVQDVFRAHEADAAVVVAYGLILPRPILDAPRLGCFNLHASALPRWRGAAPINRAIMAGDAETGVVVMQMAEGLDTGPMAMAARIAIGPDMTAGELGDELARLGADLMVRALDALERSSVLLTPQPDVGVTYATKIDKDETRIDWTKPWKVVHDHCRGLSPFPGAWFELPGTASPVRVKVLHTTKGIGWGAPGTVIDDKLTVACGDGAVRILELQRASGRPMKAEEFLRGTKLVAGMRLT
jgi:methionyl-tRNA formyltransferase